jgi:GntR family phosphonate transport system transcriptional regulator
MVCHHKKTNEPVYIQLAKSIQKEINRHHKDGEGLPSENSLAQRYGVNRHTIRRAIDELVSAGIVERKAGRGIFILNAQIHYKINSATRFTETLNAQGLSSKTTILGRNLHSADTKIATLLGVTPGSRIIVMDTLRSSNDHPICLGTHYLDAMLFPDFLESFTQGSLHHFILEHYGIAIVRNRSQIEASLPEPQDASLLKIPHNHPILNVNSLNVDEQIGSPVEYVETRFRADRIILEVSPNETRNMH